MKKYSWARRQSYAVNKQTNTSKGEPIHQTHTHPTGKKKSGEKRARYSAHLLRGGKSAKRDVGFSQGGLAPRWVHRESTRVGWKKINSPGKREKK